MLTVIVIAIGSALPFAVPPAVEHFATAKMKELGFPGFVKMSLGYTWRKGPELTGTIAAKLADSPWRVRAEFGAGFGEWHAAVTIPETDFDETDPTLCKLMEMYPSEAVSNLTFAGSVAMEAAVERTRSLPVPVWKAKLPVKIKSTAMTSGEKMVSVSDFAVTPGASGIANHFDIDPMFFRAKELNVSGFSLTNLFAVVRASEKGLFVSEAGAGLCGGKVSLYSLFLDPKSLNAGLTLFLDGVDAGEALSHFKGFKGDASGLLHGKIKLFIKEGGKSLRLSDAYLYSTPGETGKLHMQNADAITDNLALAGIDVATRNNVSTALADLDYTVLKLDLKRGKGESATLGICIEGTATRGDLTVPVNINVNINGEIEQLINTGLGYADKLKGNRK